LAEIIVVTSGKGGVGKTTTSASIACGLAKAGKKTAVIDFDVGLRNLDLIMGCERRVVYDFVNVVLGEANIKQALIKDKRFENLFVLAASQTRDKDALTKEGVEKVLKDIADEGFDFIVCDSPAGIEKGAFLAMYFADRAVVVVNPEVSSVRDSDRILGLLASKTKKAEAGERVLESLLLTRYSPERVEKGAFLAMYFADQAVVVVNPEVSSVRDSDRILGLLASKTRRAEAGERVKEFLLLTRYSPSRVEDGEMLSVKDVEEVLGLQTIGVIPESGDVLNASNKGEPVILDMESNAGQAYDDAVARLLGEERPMRFTTVEKKGFFNKLFGG
jgi:septum site-determining protein MinD